MLSAPPYMFLKQLVEDYKFEDLKFMFENDKYFTYLSNEYKFTEEDEINFKLLLESDVEFKKYSLEVVTMKKEGLLPIIYLIDHEDELKTIKHIELDELSSYPVDMIYSKDDRKSLQILIVILLTKSYYRHLEEKNKSRQDLSDVGGINISRKSELEK